MAEKEKSYQMLKDCYIEEFPCIKASSEGEKHALSIFCWSSFTISHSGIIDITKHMGKKKHLGNVELVNISEKWKIHNLFKEDDQSAFFQAELYFTSFFIDHNMLLAAADHDGPLFRKLFSSFDVAKQYGCAPTKILLQ